MNLDSHPVGFVRSFLPAGKRCLIDYSVYKYKPQSLMDDRTCFSSYIDDFTDEFIQRKFDQLKHDEELALHSCLRVDGKKMHLPMIDFKCGIGDFDYSVDVIKRFIPGSIFNGLKYYESGRSMHAYGSSLIGQKEWLDMMGRLLLCNLPSGIEIIDTRWIGHRIIARYSSLRLSCNTDNYLCFPRLIC